MPLRRGGQVFVCHEVPVMLNLGSFFSVFRLETELLVQQPDSSVMGVLENRVRRFTDPTKPWANYLESEKKEAQDKAAEKVGAFDEMVKDVSRLQVQVP